MKPRMTQSWQRGPQIVPGTKSPAHLIWWDFAKPYRLKEAESDGSRMWPRDVFSVQWDQRVREKGVCKPGWVCKYCRKGYAEVDDMRCVLWGPRHQSFSHTDCPPQQHLEKNVPSVSWYERLALQRAIEDKVLNVPKVAEV
jgi:hypothetical protein